MRSNFRPNARLIINIGILIGTFGISINLRPISTTHKYKNICADFQSKLEYSDKEYIETAKNLGIHKNDNNFSVIQFCSFY